MVSPMLPGMMFPEMTVRRTPERASVQRATLWSEKLYQAPPRGAATPWFARKADARLPGCQSGRINENRSTDGYLISETSISGQHAGNIRLDARMPGSVDRGCPS